MARLVKHHVKYKEIHGVDEVVLMPEKKHRALHRRLRKEGKCNIPPKELAKISIKAMNRCKVTISITKEQKEQVKHLPKSINLDTMLKNELNKILEEYE